MRTLREVLDGNTVTPEERKRRRVENRERFWRDQVPVTPIERKELERIYGRRLGRLIGLFSFGDY